MAGDHPVLPNGQRVVCSVCGHAISEMEDEASRHYNLKPCGNYMPGYSRNPTVVPYDTTRHVSRADAIALSTRATHVSNPRIRRELDPKTALATNAELKTLYLLAGVQVPAALTNVVAELWPFIRLPRGMTVAGAQTATLGAVVPNQFGQTRIVVTGRLPLPPPPPPQAGPMGVVQPLPAPQPGQFPAAQPANPIPGQPAAPPTNSALIASGSNTINGGEDGDEDEDEGEYWDGDEDEAENEPSNQGNPPFDQELFLPHGTILGPTTATAATNTTENMLYDGDDAGNKEAEGEQDNQYHGGYVAAATPGMITQYPGPGTGYPYTGTHLHGTTSQAPGYISDSGYSYAQPYGQPPVSNSGYQYAQPYGQPPVSGPDDPAGQPGHLAVPPRNQLSDYYNPWSQTRQQRPAPYGSGHSSNSGGSGGTSSMYPDPNQYR